LLSLRTGSSLGISARAARWPRERAAAARTAALLSSSASASSWIDRGSVSVAKSLAERTRAAAPCPL
jgi:hypothetical protein